jgi:16S rRNA (guanine527-N7)-methyltransferase
LDGDVRSILIEGCAAMGITLNQDATSRFETYLSLLQAWGRKINLTTRLEARDVVIHHFLDSLSGVRFISGEGGARVVDLGAGAGLPSFPLKFALPLLRLTLIESVRKKVSFCQEVIRATRSTGIDAVWGRSEELALKSGHRGAYDWAVSRALGQCADVACLALPFLLPGGRILLYKGEPAQGELLSLESLCSHIGATWELYPVVVPHLAARRSLILVRSPGA